MSADQVVEWVLKALPWLVSIIVFLMGREIKRNEEVVRERATALQHLLEEKAEAFDRLIDERFAARDQQIAHASDAANKVMEKINTLTPDVAVIKADSADLHKRYRRLSDLVDKLVLQVERRERPRA